MPLTPDEVRSQKFRTVRLREGYEMGEVDAFLERVAASLAELSQEIAENTRATTAAAEVLALAQRTADEHIAAAQAQAQLSLESLQHQADALNARISELEQIERDYRSRLKDFISSHLDEL